MNIAYLSNSNLRSTYSPSYRAKLLSLEPRIGESPMQADFGNAIMDIDTYVDLGDEGLEMVESTPELLEDSIQTINRTLDYLREKEQREDTKGATPRNPQRKTKKSSQRQQVKAQDPQPPKTLMGDYPEEIKIMRRFLQLVNKEIYTEEECEKLLKALQKRITDRKIRKTSKWRKDIEYIQHALLKLLEAEDSTLSRNRVARISQTVGEFNRADAIQLLKAFISLLGTPDKIRVIRLMERYRRYDLSSTKLAKELHEAYRIMGDYTEGKIARIAPTGSLSLRGVHGLGAVEGNDGVVSSTMLPHLQFDTLRLESRFEDLLGRPSKPFKLLIHGAPGSGKTTLALKLASSLARHNRLRVLIVSIEEGVGYLAKKRIEALRLQSENLYLSATLPDDLSPYDAVVVDSVTALGKSPAELRDLYAYYPDLSWVLISQNRKDGRARGSLEFEHDVDTTIKCENLLATAVKNRFGGRETMRIL